MFRHAVIALLLGLPPAAHAQDVLPGEKGEGIRTCREMHLSAWSIWSKTDIEDVIAAEILANLDQYGAVDWDCMARTFAAQGRKFEVKIFRNVPASEAQGSPGHDTYRFKVDRTSNPLAVLASPGPGNANGEFTAIINQFGDGGIAINLRGSGLRWLKSE